MVPSFALCLFHKGDFVKDWDAFKGVDKLKNRYIKTSAGMYLNYFMLGMINIIVASNMHNLSSKYHVSVEKISLLVSAIGIGKLVSLFLLVGFPTNTAGNQ